MSLLLFWKTFQVESNRLSLSLCYFHFYYFVLIQYFIQSLLHLLAHVTFLLLELLQMEAQEMGVLLEATGNESRGHIKLKPLRLSCPLQLKFL
jgi:hypothetical protein